MSGIYHFDWGRDKAGYELRTAGGTGEDLLSRYRYEQVVGLGGPVECYRPLEEHPTLWRRFADTCVTREGIIPFVNDFGLPDDGAETVSHIIRLGELLRQIAYHYDKDERDEALEIFNEANPRATAKIFRSDKGLLELKSVPLTLAGAMLIQAGETLTGNHQFRRCLNCPEWIRLGVGAHSTRREFCSDRCRVAFNRKLKREATEA